MPRAKKPPGTAVDRRNGQRADLKVAGPGSSAGVVRFDPPAGLSAAAVEAWEAFWADRPALLLTPSSKAVLLRWIDGLDRYLRTTAEADREPLVAGSTGQPAPNPLYRIAELALRTVEACERQLGVGGLNAAALGLAAIQERRSLADMNARYGTADRQEGGDGGDEEDPRLTVVDAS